MRGGRLAAFALAAVLGSSASLAAEPPRAISGAEFQALPEADQIKLVAEQIASFIETSGKYDAQRIAKMLEVDVAPPAALAAAVREKFPAQVGDLAVYSPAIQDNDTTRHPLRQIILGTRAHATAVSSLCVSDQLILDYLWKPKADADTPVSMGRLGVYLTYGASKAPASPVAAAVTSVGLRADEAACQALDLRAQHFVHAFDAEGAWRGFWVKSQIEAALKQDVLPFELACTDGTSADQCRQAFEGGMKNFSDIRPCNAQTCILGISNGLRDAAATFDSGPVPKIRRVTVQPIMPPAPTRYP
jgi:hypothetical protein